MLQEEDASVAAAEAAAADGGEVTAADGEGSGGLKDFDYVALSEWGSRKKQKRQPPAAAAAAAAEEDGGGGGDSQVQGAGAVEQQHGKPAAQHKVS
jgi:hypothetical protein